ncbi:YkvA family protein [Rheinheimera sp.]|uniref:YkvA family protein n=1 Tax=Rheinheimera sp. TaxID=1869214 RepID=UPI003AF909B9
MYDHFYSDSRFFSKVRRVFQVAGKELINKALLLYFVLQRPDLPATVKAVIICSLAYFIWPLDAIPDVLVPLGYTDDLAMLSSALLVAAVHVD